MPRMLFQYKNYQQAGETTPKGVGAHPGRLEDAIAVACRLPKSLTTMFVPRSHHFCLWPIFCGDVSRMWNNEN
jgi:hypothetical protein